MKRTSKEIRAILIGVSCTHRRMRWCCPTPCGHLYCPDCGLYWDDEYMGDPL